jgi:hypothetical protein
MMRAKAWFERILTTIRARSVLHQCRVALIRCGWMAVRGALWLCISIVLLPSLIALLVAAAFELLLQWLVRIDERLADRCERAR